MFQSGIRLRSALLVGALLCLLVPSSAVATGTPAAVTVKVEGLTETKVPSTLLTTTTTPVVKDGNPEHSCAGTSAAGALELATKGAWGGKWFSGLGYSVETIENESYPFTQPYYWAFWVNHKSQEVGVCSVELDSGDEVLLFPECFSEKAGECPANPTPLGIEAPTTANAGEAVTVTVKQYGSQGEAAPAVGADVGGGGTGASTDSQGHATLKFSGDGTYTLRVTGAPGGPPAVRTETTICIHEGNDGTCGTTLPSSAPTFPMPASSTVQPTPYVGPDAIIVDAAGLIDGHVYSRKHAPRTLAGEITVHNTLTEVGLRLTRTVNRGRGRRRCSYYDAVTERFHAMRCGAAHGKYFSIAAHAAFSYLLPSKLPPGRYVFDIEASDGAGNHSKLARGSSRIVFYVE